jgi:hypothetical protein
MTARTIVTSQPDVACDVCERRLLRGEQPDVFIAAGRRLTVCELCAPRATHEGWVRESEVGQLTLPAPRPRRGRSFLERLRQVGRPPAEAARGLDASEHEPGGAEALAPRAGARLDAAALGQDGWIERGREGARAPVPASEPTYVERAVEVFNASEFPRRIAGVARSLGAPEVSVRAAEHIESVIVLVVAWELCWYRYEIDLSDGLEEVRALEQGTELGELRHDDRLANALLTDGGTIALAAAAL